MRKTKKEYEVFLNHLYIGSGYTGSPDAVWMGEYMLPRALRLLLKGKYGTALRRYDPIAFEVGYREWKEGDKNVA